VYARRACKKKRIGGGGRGGKRAKTWGSMGTKGGGGPLSGKRERRNQVWCLGVGVRGTTYGLKQRKKKKNTTKKKTCGGGRGGVRGKINKSNKGSRKGKKTARTLKCDPPKVVQLGGKG